MSDSILVRLRPGLSRDDADNPSTHYWVWPERTRPAFREIFVQNYESLRSARDALSGPGVTVTVIGPSGFEGTAAIAARPDGINALSIGRHSHAHLFLSGEMLLSLRQGAVILYPLVDENRVRFRVLDLRARNPFEDERGARVAALEADGPVFLQAGAYSVFVFPRGRDSAPWSRAPERVWDEMPERVYLEDRGFEHAEELFRDRTTGRGGSEGTLAVALPGPSLEHERLLEEGEAARGRLTVRSADGEMTLTLGPSAAGRGVLLGRYAPCDGSRSAVLSGAAISRVHALVIEIAGQLYAVDAGSKNGLWLRGNRVAVARLRPGAPVALARTAATLDWCFLH